MLYCQPASAVQIGSTVPVKFALSGGKLQLAIGPAATYWNEGLKASGNYEVKASFTENKHNPGHPHSYGVFIGGSDLETPNQAFAYCIVYANGTYSVKYFNGAKVTNVVNREQSPAVRKAVIDALGEQLVRKVVLYELMSLDGVAEEPGNWMFDVDADVFAPCALGAVVNDDTGSRSSRSREKKAKKKREPRFRAALSLLICKNGVRRVTTNGIQHRAVPTELSDQNRP